MTLQYIKEFLDEQGFSYRYYGADDIEIEGFSDPKDYRKGTVIWIGKPADIDTAHGTAYGDISLAFVRENTGAEDVLPNVFVMADPKTAFMRLVIRLHGDTVHEYRDATAYVAPTAVIGDSCFIGRNVIVEDGAIIGNRCRICENTYIGKDCVLGDDCLIGQNVIIGGETNGSLFEDSDGLLKDMPNIGKVVVGNAVRIGAGSIIARATFTETCIGNECEINAGTSIGHNCKVGNRVQLLGRCTISGNTHIGDNSQLISAFVKNRISIGRNVKVGIGSVVLESIADGHTCFGNPARILPNLHS